MSEVDEWIKTEQAKHCLCACGCGTEIIITAGQHRPSKGLSKFIRGHNPKKHYTGEKHHNFGKTPSIESRIKMSESSKGQIAWNKGIPMSAEAKHKLSLSKSGKKHHYYGKHFTEEHKRKISKSHMGLRPSEETLEKLRLSHTGHKHSEEHRSKMSQSNIGINNPNWKGGVSFEPYCYKFNNELKERIRDRDNRTCQNCGVKEIDKKLTCHHIHYDKENCYPDLITLCHSCNSKANGKRDYWEEYYMVILETRGLLNWS